MRVNHRHYIRQDRFELTEINLICMYPYDFLREDVLPKMRISIKFILGIESLATYNY